VLQREVNRLLDLVTGTWPNPARTFHEALLARPAPLYHQASDLLLVWSCKAASAQIVLWYLYQCGLMETAAAHHWWPHRYRNEVLLRSASYRATLQECDPDKVRAVQFVREPVSRCLSIYRHYLRHGRWDRRMSRVLWRRVSSHEGFSLNTFLDFLECENGRRVVDPHRWPQRHPVADFVEVEPIALDPTGFYETLNELAAERGLTQIDFESMPQFQALDARRSPKGAKPEPAGADTVLTRNDGFRNWPLKADRLDDATVARIQRIYAADVALYEQALDAQRRRHHKPAVASTG
jgi:hypothetical protein